MKTEQDIKLDALRDQLMAALRRHHAAIILIANGEGAVLNEYHTLAQLMACLVAADLDRADKELAK